MGDGGRAVGAIEIRQKTRQKANFKRQKAKGSGWARGFRWTRSFSFGGTAGGSIPRLDTASPMNRADHTTRSIHAQPGSPGFPVQPGRFSPRRSCRASGFAEPPPPIVGAVFNRTACKITNDRWNLVRLKTAPTQQKSVVSSAWNSLNTTLLNFAFCLAFIPSPPNSPSPPRRTRPRWPHPIPDGHS